MQNRKYELCLRLTAEERKRLEQDAQCCGLSKTAYLRRLITGAELKARPSQEIKELRTEIHHIGNNINQIARSVNAGIATGRSITSAITSTRSPAASMPVSPRQRMPGVDCSC